MDKKEDKLRIVVIVLMTISIFLGAVKMLYDKKEAKSNDGEKFSLEYKKIPATNMFKYRTLEDANNLIENGSGYFFFCNKRISFIWIRYF